MGNINNKECKICHGRRYIPKDVHDIYDICPKCGGLGYMDWISRAMGQNTTNHNRNIEYNIAYRNIEALKHLIVKEARKVGQDVFVEIKSVPERDMLTNPIHHKIKSYRNSGGY